MSKIIIGIDPDSTAHGVAIYRGNELITLKSMPFMELLFELRPFANLDLLEVHIEDVCANSAMWHGKKESQAAKNMMSQRLGMCKQAQKQVEEACAWYKIKVVKHKISKRWKKEKAQFEKITGWKGQSNEDTRSAAYFGYLGLKR